MSVVNTCRGCRKPVHYSVEKGAHCIECGEIYTLEKEAKMRDIEICPGCGLKSYYDEKGDPYCIECGRIYILEAQPIPISFEGRAHGICSCKGECDKGTGDCCQEKPEDNDSQD